MNNTYKLDYSMELKELKSVQAQSNSRKAKSKATPFRFTIDRAKEILACLQNYNKRTDLILPNRIELSTYEGMKAYIESYISIVVEIASFHYQYEYLDRREINSKGLWRCYTGMLGTTMEVKELHYHPVFNLNSSPYWHFTQGLQNKKACEDFIDSQYEHFEPIAYEMENGLFGKMKQRSFSTIFYYVNSSISNRHLVPLKYLDQMFAFYKPKKSLLPILLLQLLVLLDLYVPRKKLDKEFLMTVVRFVERIY